MRPWRASLIWWRKCKAEDSEATLSALFFACVSNQINCKAFVLFLCLCFCFFALFCFLASRFSLAHDGSHLFYFFGMQLCTCHASENRFRSHLGTVQTCALCVRLYGAHRNSCFFFALFSNGRTCKVLCAVCSSVGLVLFLTLCSFLCVCCYCRLFSSLFHFFLFEGLFCW